jgi:hypothetical protein
MLDQIGIDRQSITATGIVWQRSQDGLISRATPQACAEAGRNRIADQLISIAMRLTPVSP